MGLQGLLLFFSLLIFSKFYIKLNYFLNEKRECTKKEKKAWQNSSAEFFPGIDTGEATLMQIFWLMRMGVQARIHCTSCSRSRQSSSGWEHFLCQIQTVCESPWPCFSENRRDVFSGTGSLAPQSWCNQFLPNSVEPPPSYVSFPSFLVFGLFWKITLSY